jgi:hypothetical protein
MQARKPDFVTINNRRVKVQQWQQLPDRVLLTALVHGNASGADLLTGLHTDTAMLQWDDSPARPVRPEITHHRKAGTGPSTVHRIEVTFWLPVEAETHTDESINAKLDRVLRELQLLRTEVAELRGTQRTGTSSIAAPLVSGRTMMDFEIDENE